MCCRCLYSRWQMQPDSQQANLLPDGAPLEPLHQPSELGQDSRRLPSGQCDWSGDAGALWQLLWRCLCGVWRQIRTGDLTEHNKQKIYCWISSRSRRWMFVIIWEIIWLGMCMWNSRKRMWVLCELPGQSFLKFCFSGCSESLYWPQQPLVWRSANLRRADPGDRL